MGSLGHIFRNFWSRGVKDLNIKTVKSFLDWKAIEKEGLHLEAREILSYCEQIIYRTRRCQSCLEAGECRVCHCPTPDLMLVPSSKCKDGLWDAYMMPEIWNKYKETNNITILVV